MSKLKISLIQLHAGPDKQENLLKAQKLIEQACSEFKPHLIALPEVFNFRGRQKLEKENAELLTEEYETFRFIKELAIKHQVAIMAGSILDARYIKHQDADHKAKPLNTAFYVNKEGKLLAEYSKVHLFDIAIEELQDESNAREFGPVDDSNIKSFSDEFEIDGKKTKVNMAMFICYDLRFPELFRLLTIHPDAKETPDIIFLPSAFSTKTGPYHWESLISARAIENSLFMLAPNQVGKSESGFDCHGNSLVVGPWGELIAKAGDTGDEVLNAELDLNEIAKTRKILPLENARLANIFANDKM